MPQYFFGFNSAFSGQTLYDPFIYQLYNITMTSLPIMWFALYDFQYFKNRFMTNPMLYKLGMNNKCFSITIFTQYLVYALVHGFMIYFFCIIALIQPKNGMQSDGTDIGFWAVGHLVYGACCFVANAIILTRTNNFTGYGEGVVALMIVAYFFFMIALSQVGSLEFQNFPDLNHLFSNMFSIGTVWLSILLTIGTTVMAELASRAWTKVISS
jgi:magnesium-transporting ATPase (P-type)